MELSETGKIALGSVVIGWVLLQAAARRFPTVAWLQRLKLPELPPAQRARARRRASFYVGVELILLGLALPLGYGALTMMTFGAFDPLWTTGVLVTAAVCVAAGVVAVVKTASE